MKRLAVVALGPPVAGAADPPAALVEDWLALEDVARAADLSAVAARSAVLWLPPWSRLAAEDWAAVQRWLAAPSASVARVRLRAAFAGGVVPAGTALVLSRPGMASLCAGVPRPRRDASVEALRGAWTVAPPASLSAHLQGVNQQTSAAVRLSRDAAPVPGAADLLRPLALVPLRVAAGSGPWRARFARAVVEGYRAVLLAAKSWERAQVAARRAT